MVMKVTLPLFHHDDHHALESALSGTLGQCYSSPGQFRQCMLGGMLQHHLWLTAGQRYLTIDVYISHQ